MPAVKMTHSDHEPLMVPDVGDAIERYERAGWSRASATASTWQPLPPPPDNSPAPSPTTRKKKTAARRATTSPPSQED